MDLYKKISYEFMNTMLFCTFIQMGVSIMENVLNTYYANNAKRLRAIVDKILFQFGGISDKDYHDFYSIANEVFIDVIRRYNGKQTFEVFLYSCLSNKVKTEITARNRQKRMIDRNSVSIDEPLFDDDKCTIADTLQSDFDINSVLEEERNNFRDEKVEKYLSGLSRIQRQIVEMKMEEISVSEIKKKLQLSNKEYEDNMKSIKQNKMISLFNKSNKREQYRKTEDIRMKEECELNMDDVMDMDTTDSYRTDKNPLGSLLEDLAMGYIDRNYISQRQPFQWNEEQINKFYSRILNNQPIPEIIICEKVEDGEKVSYLIDGLQRLTYAEEFKENRIPVKAKGAEFVNIKYKKPVEDEEGNTRFVIDTFSIAGKYYKDLPKFLQKRFDNFNVTVTRFFNCTSEIIDYHMRNYNNHVAMSKSQYGITNVTNRISKNIKTISEQHPFFKDNIDCSSGNRKKGTLDEVVAKTIMAMNFADDWKKDPVETFKFVDANATDKQFEHLTENLDRLSKVADNSVKKLFNTTNTHIWLAVFDKFISLDIPDVKFIEFMRAFDKRLQSEESQNDAFIYNIYKSRNTKDKKNVIDKINGLVKRMYDYFNIRSECKDIDVLEFIKSNIDSEVNEEDIELFDMMKEDYFNGINRESSLCEAQNNPSMLMLIAYICKEEQDEYMKPWMIDFFKRNNTYIRNQKENYLYMRNDFEKFVNRRENCLTRLLA